MELRALGRHPSRSRRSRSAATCSAGRPTSRRRFACSTRSSTPASTSIDTADSYSRWAPGHEGGESETIIGRWIARRGRHDDVVIATKVGSDMGLGYKCLRKDYIVRAVEDSLRRLQVDAIDLYQSHWDDDKTPLDETLEAYAQLIRQGKVKAIGASNLAAARLAEALDISRAQGLAALRDAAAALQPVRSRSVRRPAAAICACASSIGVITYFSLAAGFLTRQVPLAKPTSARARAARA